MEEETALCSNRPIKKIIVFWLGCNTFVIGPAGVRNELAEDPDPGVDVAVFGLNAVID